MSGAATTTASVSAPVSARNLALPLLVVLILGMMVLPLPPFLLDLLFTFNIAVSMLVLLSAVQARRLLDFASFPTVLLLTTLLRLSLNVASARVVLMNGHTGPDAAGKVIEAFGHFLVGGNFAVGLAVFVILVVINFVVITKGAGRIAEVSARFTLDAMPGKQMAIDADLNAGLIGEADARRRRSEVSKEAEFYGAMDGASKFVRGDAIAGILILVVNIVGGLAIGMIQHDLPLDTAVNNYVLLAIGDGLVAQIPALVISTAAGLVVSRVGDDEDVGEQMFSQVFSSPQTLKTTAGIIGGLGVIPGMPHLAFLLLAAGCYGLSTLAGHGPARAIAKERAEKEAKPARDEHEADWQDVTPVDVLALEVGYRLIALVDQNQNGELLRRIKAIRKKFAQDVGFLPPAVHIRDNLDLKPNAYRILMKGVVVGEGEAVPGMYLAINPGNAGSPALPGTQTRDPAFGLPAVWIEAAQREAAQLSGYTVVDAGTVAATHISAVMHQRAGGLLGRTELQQLLEHFGRFAGKIADDLVPKLIPLATFQKVLQNLLDEGVPIRDMRSIVEALLEHAGRTQDAADLTVRARIALGSSIIQQFCGPSSEIPVMVLEPSLERLVQQALGAGPAGGLEPGLADTLVREAEVAVKRHESLGHAAVLLAPDAVRGPLARLLRRSSPLLRVIAHSEVPDNRSIRVVSILGVPA
jgi:flagellar biosynthesis protein FlhA